VTNPYLSIRYNEANVLGTWKKISAGTADILTTARTIAGVSFDGSANISLNNNAITNGAGYTTNTGNGTVTSVATGNGLSGGTITSTGTLTMSGTYSGNFNFSTNNVVVGGNFTNNPYNSTSGARLMFGSGDSNSIANYYIGTNLEDFGGNYTKLSLAWHTGIKIGAQSQYGGVRFYDDEDFSNVILNIGVSNTNVGVVNDLTVGGNVGIGMTAASSKKLQVQGSNHFVTFVNPSTTANHYAQMLLKAGDRNNYIWTANQNSTSWGGAGSLNIYTAETGSSIAFFTQGDATNTKLMIQANGSIGINKTTGLNTGGFGSPKLVIKQSVNNEWGGINVEATNNDAVFAFGTTDDAHRISGSYRATAGYKPIYISTAGSIRMALDTSGNVGIGTTSPDAKLVIATAAGANTQLRLERADGAETGQIYMDTSDDLNIRNTGGSGDIILYPHETQGNTIVKNGSLGIGTTSPVNTAWGTITNTAQLSLVGSAYGVITLQGSNTALTKYSMGVGDNRFYMAYDNLAGRHNIVVNSSGYVGIQDQSPSYQLDVDGTIRATGDVIAYSDARVKDNVKTIDHALEKTTKLRGVSYTRNDIEDKSTKIGVIAQEVLEVLPEVVSKDDEGKYSVSYGNIVGVLIEAIKELEARVKELENK